jgi:NDP-sugar pyrophosphorylase family protein
VLPALVLTAGLGTRLDPLTRLVAKAAVPLAGRTLIERILGWLHREGVRDVVLNLHHRPETITAIVGDGAHLGLRVRYSWEQPILGSAGGPRRALGLIGADPFLIVNGDTLCEIPLAPLLDAHTRANADVTMTLVPNPARDHYNGVVLDDTDRVRGFVAKGHDTATWHFVGIQVVRPAVFASLPHGVPAETVSGLYRDRVASGDGRIQGWRVTDRFFDVGTPRDYLDAALAHLPAGASDAIVEEGAEVHPSARVSRSVIWPEAKVDAGVELHDCVVAGAVRIPRGFRTRSKVILPARFAKPGDRAETRDDIAVYPL